MARVRSCSTSHELAQEVVSAHCWLCRSYHSYQTMSKPARLPGTRPSAAPSRCSCCLARLEKTRCVELLRHRRARVARIESGSTFAAADAPHPAPQMHSSALLAGACRLANVSAAASLCTLRSLTTSSPRSPAPEAGACIHNRQGPHCSRRCAPLVRCALHCQVCTTLSGVHYTIRCALHCQVCTSS